MILVYSIEDNSQRVSKYTIWLEYYICIRYINNILFFADGRISAKLEVAILLKKNKHVIPFARDLVVTRVQREDV